MLLRFAVVVGGEVAEEATGSKDRTMCFQKVNKKNVTLRLEILRIRNRIIFLPFGRSIFLTFDVCSMRPCTCLENLTILLPLLKHFLPNSFSYNNEFYLHMK